MTPENLSIFENNLSEAIEKHLAAGGKIIRRAFGFDEDSCCPLTAVFKQDKQADMNWSLNNSPINICGVVATQVELWSFVFGVDENRDSLGNITNEPFDDSLFELGQ